MLIEQGAAKVVVRFAFSLWSLLVILAVMGLLYVYGFVVCSGDEPVKKKRKRCLIARNRHHSLATLSHLHA